MFVLFVLSVKFYTLHKSMVKFVNGCAVVGKNTTQQNKTDKWIRR